MTSSTSARTGWRARGVPFTCPRTSSKALLLEGKENLLRLRQEIPLSDDELRAIDDGIAAHDELVAKLADVPAPDGMTPRQIGARR